jgi:hypothetical protein
VQSLLDHAVDVITHGAWTTASELQLYLHSMNGHGYDAMPTDATDACFSCEHCLYAPVASASLLHLMSLPPKTI